MNHNPEHRSDDNDDNGDDDVHEHERINTP